jgi:hypothetical protein
MSFGIPLMLAGLAGVAIPILIHLLNRRRYEQVDWGAMRFLQISETTRRRLFLEEMLLLLLRMGLIAVLVMGLAAPMADTLLFGQIPNLAQRDAVLIIDGSYSMGCGGGGKTAHGLAKEWASDFLDGLSAGDRVAVLQAKQRVVPLVSELTGDLGRLRMTIDRLPPPRGSCDWPLAVQEAFQILSKTTTPRRDIIILSDGQRFGWADETTLMRWELLAKRRDPAAEQTRIWVVNVDPQRPADPPNWSLAPLRASRAIASVGQQVTLHTALELRGQPAYQPPHRLRLEIDGRSAHDLDAPREIGPEKGQVPISFRHRFTTPGSHLVSVIVEPDPPPEQRPAGYQLKDHLPGDNRQDLAIDVLPALPVLLVDGGVRSVPKSRGTDFLRDALAPARDPAPVVLARVVSVKDFTPALLTSDLGKEAGTKARVLVLVNVPRLLAQQQDAVTQFLANGGGVLVTLGEQVDPRHYNDQWFSNGEGWLPARLVEIAGDEAKPELAPSPLPSSFFHPALDLFREAAAGGLGEARFPRWWKVTVPTRLQSVASRSSAGAIVALLTNQDPFLVEKSYHGGRVMLSTVPLNNSWHTNLPELPAFAPLAHELIYYLAGARSAENNLQPGQPLRYRPEKDEPLDMLMLQPPGGEAKRLVYETADAANGYQARLVATPQGSQVVYDQTVETGVYRLTRKTGHDIFYVVQPDRRESDLTPCTDIDREKVRKLLPMTYENDGGRMTAGLADASSKQELWWWFLLAVIALLCGEIWMTRRIVKGR